MSQIDIGKVAFKVRCPRCGRRKHMTLSQVGHRQAGCACGVHYVPTASVNRGVQEVNRALNDLRQKLKRLGR